MRWREVKKQQKSQNLKNKNAKKGIFGGLRFKEKLQQIYAMERIKAFITDMFMINMPILYIATYIVLGSKEAFTNNQLAIFICVSLFGIILSLFFCISAQTPGYRYMNLKLVKDNCHVERSETTNQNKMSKRSETSLQNQISKQTSLQNSTDTSTQQDKLSFLQALLRFILWIIGSAFLFGLVMALFRKDGKCFHDAVCKSKVISIGERV